MGVDQTFMSVLASIQQQIADLLAAQSALSFIPILTENSGDIINEMTRALGAISGDTGKAGAFIIVMTPDANQNWKDLFGPFFDEIKVVIQVTVNVPVAKDPSNGVGLLGLDICEAICSGLSQFYPAGANAPLIPDVPTIKLVDRADDQTTHTCSYKTMGGIRSVPSQAATPTLFITEGGQYQLSTSSPGAAVFYTLDGSNPVPVNVGNAQSPKTFLYTTGFTPSTGLTLKARAFLAGLLNSETFTAQT